MTDSFVLLTLLRAGIDRLESLRKLETRFRSVAPFEKAAIQAKIDSVTDEIANLNKNIEQCKANYLARR